MDITHRKISQPLSVNGSQAPKHVLLLTLTFPLIYCDFHCHPFYNIGTGQFGGQVGDKVQMYEEIMMNDDNLESNLPTSSLLKMRCLAQVELCVYCLVAGDELTRICSGDLPLQVNLFIYSAGV